GVRARVPARALGRDEDAGLDRPRPGDEPGAAAAGRALCGARRDHSLQAQRGPVAPLAGAALDGGVRDAQRLRVRVPLAPRRGDDAAARPDHRRRAHRPGLSPDLEPAHGTALHRALPHALAPARRGNDRMSERILRMLGPAIVGALFLAAWEGVVRY